MLQLKQIGNKTVIAKRLKSIRQPINSKLTSRNHSSANAEQS